LSVFFAGLWKPIVSLKRYLNIYFNKERVSDFKEQMIPNAVFHLLNRAVLACRLACFTAICSCYAVLALAAVGLRNICGKVNSTGINHLNRGNAHFVVGIRDKGTLFQQSSSSCLAHTYTKKWRVNTIQIKILFHRVLSFYRLQIMIFSAVLLQTNSLPFL
jgi:hypothetical protein